VASCASALVFAGVAASGSAVGEASTGLIAFERVDCVYYPAAERGIQRETNEECYTSIWSVGANGGPARLLAGNPKAADAEDPAWSPNGRRIAYVGPDYEIWSMKANGSEKRRLTKGSSLKESPAWSADGRKIAFGDETGLWVMNALGTGRRRLARVDARDPAWSPDGRTIVFTSGYSIYVVNADGRRLRRLAEGNSLGEHPWSPDGRRIVFGGPVNTPLYVVNVDGTGLRRLAENGNQADWSPNGRKIAFVRAPYGPSSAVVVMNANGSNKRWLAAGEQPLWSPDGTHLAYSEGEVSIGAIHVMSASGTGDRTVVRDGHSPVWQPQPKS